MLFGYTPEAMKMSQAGCEFVGTIASMDHKIALH